MRPRLLVIALAPPPDFSRFLRELRLRYPGASVTALIGSSELRLEDGGAEAYLLWGSFGAGALVAEIRRQRFDLLVLAYNRDYCHRLAYWKALALTIASRARGVLFCEQARLPRQAGSVEGLARPWSKAGALFAAIAVRGLPRVIAYLLAELLIALLGSVLVIVLAGIIAADLSQAITGAGRRRKGPVD